MSLRARLLCMVLLATLLPALLMGWRYVRAADAEILAAVNALAAEADNMASDLDHRVQGTAQLHYGLAHARVLETHDRHACSTYLSEVREAYPQYTGIITVLPDGSLFCDSLQSGRQLNLRDRGYFKRVLEDASGLTLEPVFGRLTGNSVLQIVYPVRAPDKALQFMLVASLNLQKFADDNRRRPLHPMPELLLVDHRGMVMVWTGPAQASRKPGASIDGTPLMRLAELHANGGIGEIVDDDGKPWVWAVASTQAARSTGLHLVLGLPKQSLAADASFRLRQDLITLAAIALLLFTGVWLLADWGIRRQVARITTMVRKLGNGDLGARIELPYPRGELGGLMAVLNSTASSLQRQRAEINDLGLRLRQSQKLEAIGTLAGGIAHDFNNILGAILGNASIAHEEALAGQPTQHSLEQIRRAAVRARDLVQRIQAFSRQDAPALAEQALLPMVEEVLAFVRVTLPAGITLRAELDPQPLHVMADATQLHQVFMNLCANAWQALEGQPGTLTVRLKPAEFAHDAAQRPAGLGPGRYAHVSIGDTGCGISEAHRERIFEPFFTTKGAQGTGLGLSVVHGIVNSHRGGIDVESRVGQGSTFHVYLPLTDDESRSDGQLSLEAHTPAPVAGDGRRILYLDDDEVMGLMVERLLTRAGYRVSCHSSAHAALAALRDDPLAFDLLVTDFNMPEQSGLEVSRSIAVICPGLPVLIISGYIFDELPAQARRAGVLEVIRKQNVLEELVPAIGRALASKAER